MDATQLKSKTLTDKSPSVKQDTNPKSGDHPEEHEIIQPEDIVPDFQKGDAVAKLSTDEIVNSEGIVQDSEKKKDAPKLSTGSAKYRQIFFPTQRQARGLGEAYKKSSIYGRGYSYPQDKQSADELGFIPFYPQKRAAPKKPPLLRAIGIPSFPKKEESEESINNLSYCSSQESVKKESCVQDSFTKQKSVGKIPIRVKDSPNHKSGGNIPIRVQDSSTRQKRGGKIPIRLGGYCTRQKGFNKKEFCPEKFLQVEKIETEISKQETVKIQKKEPVKIQKKEPVKIQKRQPVKTQKQESVKALPDSKNKQIGGPLYNSAKYPALSYCDKAIQCKLAFEKKKKPKKNIICNLPPPCKDSTPLTEEDIVEDMLCKFKDLILTDKPLGPVGYKEKLRSSVYQAITKSPTLNSEVLQNKEPLEYVQKTQSTWEQRISKSLNNMSSDLGIPFSRKRPVSEQIEFEAKWSELGSEDMDLGRFRPVYSPKDFLDVLVNIKNPNGSTQDQGTPTYWGLIRVPLKVKKFHELKIQFEELSANIDHLGLDVSPFSGNDFSNKCLKERVSLGSRVLKANQAVLAREFCKRGCPATLRSKLWSLILGVEVTGSNKLNFKHLKSCVFQHDLLIDKLIFKDIHLTASNDDQYFVFEDLLYQILLVFSRDTSILSHFENSSSSPPRAMLRSSLTSVPYPPNGVIPFHGFSMLVAPLCYIYEDAITLYYIFRELYIRYFFRLHSVNAHPQGALSLALQFETALDEIEPQLANHFHKHDIQPLKIAMKWIVKAFSGSLAVEQILQLWDCVLAYDSTEIIIVLAVGIFSFRKTILLQAENQATVENILADISAVKVIPLLHGMLANGHQQLRHAPNISSR